jgi:hypothetical protein
MDINEAYLQYKADRLKNPTHYRKNPETQRDMIFIDGQWLRYNSEYFGSSFPMERGLNDYRK